MMTLLPRLIFADDGKIVVADVEDVENGHVVHLQWTADAQQIAAVPIWSLDAGKFPLSAEDAIKISRTQLVASFPDVKKWKLDDLYLRMIKNNGNDVPAIRDKYYYMVHLVPANEQDVFKIEKSANGDLSCYEVVLADGTALKPHNK